MSPPISRQKWRLIASPSPVPPYLLLVRGLGLGERLEQPAELLLGHPDPGVGDGEGEPVVGLSLHGQADGAVVGELGGVGEQVEQRLPHLGQVGVHRRRGRRGSRRPACCRSSRPAAGRWPRRPGPGPATSNVSRNRSIRPASILERSRMSLISPSRCLPAALIFWRSGMNVVLRRGLRPPPGASRSSR